MKKGALMFVVGLLELILSEPTVSEKVWLKDVTTRFQTNKRAVRNLELPDEITFHLRRRSDALVLNLKRNHEINPNADIYFVRKLKDGRSILAKARNLKEEAVAYYQDRENGAYMTVRCVKRSNEQCDIVINGNIQIGDNSYDLQPAETDVTSRNLWEVPGLLGRQYVLRDQTYIQRENSVENKDAASDKKKNTEQELLVPFRRFLHVQEKQNHFPRQDTTLSSRNVAGLHNRGATDQKRDARKFYYVEVAVLIDPGVWNIYSSNVRTSNPLTKRKLVKKTIREAFSHIMNGVSLRYKQIEDTSLSISVTLGHFIFFQHEALFPHNASRVKIVNGNTNINAIHYIDDLADWDKDKGINYLPFIDHAMLFTRYDLHAGEQSNSSVLGIAINKGVCDTGERISIIKAYDYFRTVRTAAHEFGHNLGADHDGEKDAIACKSEDDFIMSAAVSPVGPDDTYSRNPWMFSNCSVKSFKKRLKNRKCVATPGKSYSDQLLTMNTMKQPGEVYSPNEQCYHINGPESGYCGTEPAEICHLMRCKDPKTGKCPLIYYSADRGTECGKDMWCIEGRCVPTHSNDIDDF